jgi:hypothetical protein
MIGQAMSRFADHRSHRFAKLNTPTFGKASAGQSSLSSATRAKTGGEGLFANQTVLRGIELKDAF